MHEIMCPADDSHNTLEFSDHFVIMPSIEFYSRKIDFHSNGLKEQGKPVDYGFEYNSGTNSHFLSQAEILMMDNKI